MVSKDASFCHVMCYRYAKEMASYAKSPHALAFAQQQAAAAAAGAGRGAAVGAFILNIFNMHTARLLNAMRV